MSRSLVGGTTERGEKKKNIKERENCHWAWRSCRGNFSSIRSTTERIWGWVSLVCSLVYFVDSAIRLWDLGRGVVVEQSS